MGSRSSAWKIVIGLAVVCMLLVFAGGFFHRRGLESSVLEAQDTSSLYVKTKLTHAVEGFDLSEPLKDSDAAALAKDVDLPEGDGLRIFAPDGTVVFTSQVLEAFPADEEPLATAKAGDVSRVIDGSDLRVYAPIFGKAQRVMAIAAVVTNYTQIRHDVSGPLDDLRLPFVGLGVVLLVVGLILMLQATKSQLPIMAPRAPAAPEEVPAQRRVTGFEPVARPVAPPAIARPVAPSAEVAATQEASTPDEVVAEPETAGRKLFGIRLGKRPSAVAEEPAAVAPAPSQTATPALEREVAIRQALEDQLEQLRTQVKTQQDERVTATRELTAQLEEAMRRADEAEARAELGTAGDAAGRIAAIEQQMAQARSAAAEATARAEQLQRVVDAAPDPAVDHRVAELTAQLTDAQQRASSAEQRAASVESVRDELEVRVAQLGTKAGELERRAGELEGSLQEANAGGDAVRAEIATLTAALAAANARVQELAAAPTSSTSDTDRQADHAEIARLRGELASHMERAQAAEERVATLEADLLAASRGVSALPASAPAEPPVRRFDEPRTEAELSTVPPAPAGVDRYDDVWTSSEPPVAATPEPVRSAPEVAMPTPEVAASTPEPVAEHAERKEATDEPASTEEPGSSDEDEQLSPDDMWSLRARLADAAARKRLHSQ
jgi:hypothetical protein